MENNEGQNDIDDYKTFEKKWNYKKKNIRLKMKL